jgi:hypothetical protein
VELSTTPYVPIAWFLISTRENFTFEVDCLVGRCFNSLKQREREIGKIDEE